MRKTIAYFILAAALAAYVYFYEIKGGEKREAEKTKAEKLFNFEKDSVDSFEVNSYRGTFKFVKNADGWRIEEPVQTAADDSPISTLLSGLASSKKERSFAVDNGELGQYGLDNRALSIKLSTNDGQVMQLKLGDKTSVGSNVYASTLDTMVHMVGSNLKQNAEKSLFDWRDKKAIHFKKDQIREFTLKNPMGTFTFVKSGSDWDISRPINTKADKSKVDEVLNKLDFGRINAVVSEDDQNPAQWRLSRPAYRLELLSGSEKAKMSVVFSSLKENKAYGKDGARPHVFEVDSNFVKPFNPDLFTFRKKKIVEFSRARVDRINLFFDGHLMKFEKDTSNNWIASDGGKAKGWKIDNIVSTLEGLKATKFVEEDPRYLMPYGLVNPEGKVEVFAGDEQLAVLDVGNTKGESVYVRNSMAKPVMTIDKENLEKLFPPKEDLLEEVKTEPEETEQ